VGAVAVMEYGEIREWVNRCVRCGTCKYIFGLYEPSCPAGEKFRFESFFASGKMWIARGLLDGALSFQDPGILEKIYACTLCGSCSTQCTLPQGEFTVEIFEALRARAVEEGAGPLPGHQDLIKSLKSYRNPWMQPRSARERWTKNKGIKELGIKRLPAERAEVLYYVGCTAAVSPDVQPIALATARVLSRAGVDFGLLGRDEVCCGSTLLRIGERERFVEIARENMETINALGVRTIITSCAGCLRSLRKDYPAIGEIEPEVLHTSEYLARLLDQGRLPLHRPVERRVTYHDPCHLGRHIGIFEAPRRILSAIPGVRFSEMERTRDVSWCCGAGGGVRTAFPDWATETAALRIEEARATGAEALVSTCPFCFHNLDQAIKITESPIEMIDLVELVGEAL